ncbi:hypothetical protein BJ165DRAFT_1408654 [Panaeolus papilionaceus]|nr:hypothetical protein BJ165DRAFT_1408654 [Panaeolus papilionaceus]
MPIIELVIVGASRVGKTSLRVKVLATIGFILSPKQYNPDDGDLVLQRSDTASQERFSSFSTAFFRGADTVRDEDEAKFCVVVVGNKVDVVEGGAEGQDENPDRVVVGAEAQVEGECELDLSLSQHTLMPDQGSTGTTETMPTSKVVVLNEK